MIDITSGTTNTLMGYQAGQLTTGTKVTPRIGYNTTRALEQM